jgi:hypothetical protein
VKVKLAKIINEGKKGQTYAGLKAITNLINSLRWQHTKTNRVKLYYYLNKG